MPKLSGRPIGLASPKTIPEAEIGEIHYLPCHPGCFPADTLVATPHGRRAIETIQAGDLVTIVAPSGETASAEVQTVFITDNLLWRIATDAGVLLATQTQPLCLSLSKAIPAGDLRPGDKILHDHAGEFRHTAVLDVTQTDRTTKVYNVILGNKQLFIASGFLARSKPPARD